MSGFWIVCSVFCLCAARLAAGDVGLGVVGLSADVVWEPRSSRLEGKVRLRWRRSRRNDALGFIAVPIAVPKR